MSDKNGVDYGPLETLIGTWEGEKGTDIAPEPDGTEKNLYYETIVFEPAGDLQNAESQTLACVRYHQEVRRKENDEVFHDETGYWMWDAREQVIMHSLTIPRAVCVLAGAKYVANKDQRAVTLNVSAKLDDPDWGILQSPFMRDNARTVGFDHKIVIDGNRLSYAETTWLEIYGRSFEHTDENVLTLRE